MSYVFKKWDYIQYIQTQLLGLDKKEMRGFSVNNTKKYILFLDSYTMVIKNPIDGFK